MSQERIEAAAKAAAKDEDASNWHDEPDYYRNGWCNRMAAGIAAADEVMFSDEAIERAARAMLDAMYGGKTLKVDDEDRAIVRAVVAALKGDA